MKPNRMIKIVEEQILSSYEELYRIAYTYVRNENDALDIVQESVYKAMKSADSIKDKTYIKTWLCRIVMNTAVDFIRKNKKEIAAEILFEEGTEDQYQDFDTIEALNILEEREKAVIILRYFEDRKIDEVAAVLNENVNTVKSILYRSLKKLKVEIGKGEEVYEG